MKQIEGEELKKEDKRVEERRHDIPFNFYVVHYGDRRTLEPDTISLNCFHKSIHCFIWNYNINRTLCAL